MGRSFWGEVYGAKRMGVKTPVLTDERDEQRAWSEVYEAKLMRRSAWGSRLQS